MAGDAYPVVLEPGAAQKVNRLAFFFRALHSRNYRLFFSGQLVSLIGTWLTTAAMSWLVYRLTGRSQILGLIGFCAQIPAFILTPFAGVYADRWRRHRTLIWTQTFSMMQSFGLAIVAFTVAKNANALHPHAIHLALAALFVLAIFQGLINAFDIPVRQSFVVDLVERREDLSNAIALNSSMFNAARLLGPVVAGVLIEKVGEGWCFSIDGVSYLGVIAALLMMKVTEKKSDKPRGAMGTEMKDGVRYAYRFGPIRVLLLFMAFVSFAGVPQGVLMPVFATKVLHGDATTQGLLMGASAVGALIGALLLAGRKSIVGLGRLIPIVTTSLGFGLMLLAFSTYLPLSMLALAIIGFSMMTQMAAGNTMLQTVVEDHMRGRVMSLFTMAVMGTMPFGALIVGTLADVPWIGTRWTTFTCGVLCMGAAAAFLSQLPMIRREVRPIYIKKGIIQESVRAVQAVDTVIEEEH